MRNISIRDKSRRIAVKKFEFKLKSYKALQYIGDLKKYERFHIQNNANQLPRNSHANRVSNRCVLSDRSHSVYKQFKLSRIKLRDYALMGLLPGVQKSSW
jgi:small subunit ribosomal protein S14